MGAHNIEFKIDGEVGFSAIQKKFREIREDNASENGHRDGYSGDFQTVHEVKDHTHKVFDSFNEAHNYCLDTAEKWVNVIAVRYKEVAYTPSKKALKLQLKVGELRTQLQTIESQPVKLAKFATCEGCRSKLSTAHAFTPGVLQRQANPYSCPICYEGDFRPLGIQRKITKLKSKIKLLAETREALIKAERAKAMAKKCKINTLVAGWGAS